MHISHLYDSEKLEQLGQAEEEVTVGADNAARGNLPEGEQIHGNQDGNQDENQDMIQDGIQDRSPDETPEESQEGIQDQDRSQDETPERVQDEDPGP